MATNDEPIQLIVGHRIRRKWLLSLAATIAYWFYPIWVPDGSIPDKLLGLGCRIARPEYRVDGGPWQPMGTITHGRSWDGDGFTFYVHPPKTED
jgi:hypothetical protein